MKRKDALRLRLYDNTIFDDLIQRFIHKETDRDILRWYFVDGKSIKEISQLLDEKTNLFWSTRHIWDVKEKGGAYLFDLYDKIQRNKTS